MKKVFSTIYYCWLLSAVAIAFSTLVLQPTIVWVGVLMTSLPPLVNCFWRFDDGYSPSTKARYPLLSLWVLVGLAWVLLTLSDLGLPLWLTLGALGGFLLQSYWDVASKT